MAGRQKKRKNKKLITQMKKLPILSLIAVIALAASCKTTGNDGATVNAAADSIAVKSNIAYFQLDKVIAEYDMANDTLGALQTIQGNVAADLQRREAKITKEATELNEKYQKGLIISSSYQMQMEKIQKSAEAFQQHAAQKQQELQERQVVAMNQIADAIKNYVDAYNADGKFDIILANQGGTPVITGNPGLDLTQAIIDGLNEEYLKVKNGKK